MVSWNYQSDVSEQGVRKRLAQMALVSRYEHCILLGLSVQFIRSVVSDSLWPYELQHTRPPCPSPTPRVYSNSCPSSQWCHPTISSSVIPFSSCPQSLPASGCFPMSQVFTWSGQSTGVSASASVLPMNTQDWSPLGWTWSLQAQNELPESSNYFLSSFISPYTGHLIVILYVCMCIDDKSSVCMCIICIHIGK